MVTVETKAFNQRGEEVCYFRRKVMVWKQAAAPRPPAALRRRRLGLSAARRAALRSGRPALGGRQPARPALAGHARPLGGAGERGDAPADPGRPGGGPVPAVPGRVPDARRPAPPPVPPTSCGRGRGSATTGGPCHLHRAATVLVERPRRSGARRPRRAPGAARRRRLHRPGGAGLRLRSGHRGGRHQRGPGAGPGGGRSSPPCWARPRTLADRLVPRGRSWAFNQALFDLGAGFCTSRRPRCGDCPLRRHCAWTVAGQPAPDPAAGSAATARPQSRFAGSDRQGRGRLVAALRRGPVAEGALASAAGWPDDPGRAWRAAEGLVAEGFARWVGGSLGLA